MSFTTSDWLENFIEGLSDPTGWNWPTGVPAPPTGR